VLIDRGEYWQCAFVIPKGKADELRAGGIEPIRQAVHAAAPQLDLGDLDEVEGLKLLSVSLDRLTRWWMPGVLAIGDAAHAMSPIGGSASTLQSRLQSRRPTSWQGRWPAPRRSLRCSPRCSSADCYPPA
jgi:2-polyprenyl-6-methoxyphenol hydroxylase-like FAD-dependent oxidoreductase